MLPCPPVLYEIGLHGWGNHLNLNSYLGALALAFTRDVCWMVRVEVEGVIPIPRDTLWKVLALHLNDATISKIHPSILSQKTISQEGTRSYQDLTLSEITTVEREVITAGRKWKCTWRIKVSPPEEYRFEVLASSGVLAAGSYIRNTYSDSPMGTRIVTVGEMHPMGIPRFLQGWLVRRRLNRADKEDIEYLKNMP